MEQLAQFPHLTALFFIITGLVFGSFTSALTYRFPRGIGIAQARSFCPWCNHTLGIYDLVPVFSWLISKGKCRHCQQKISLRYPLIECATALGFYLVYQQYGLGHYTLLLLAITVCLITLSIIDFEYGIIPDTIQIILVILAILYNSIFTTFSWQNLAITLTLAALTGYGIRAFYLWIRKKEMLGLGDTKFMLVAACFLTYQTYPLFLLLAGCFGIILGTIWKKTTEEETFPFGPALALALFILLLYPDLPQWIILPT